jgi:hypothetical protein
VCYLHGDRKKPCPTSVFCGVCCKDTPQGPIFQRACKCSGA